MSVSFEGRYCFGKALFSFDNGFFADAFAQAYSLQRATSDDKSDFAFSVRTLPPNSYVVRTPLREEITKQDFPRIAGIIDYDLDELIRSVASDELLSLHASSAVVNSKALLFLGISGCGKTTLGIEAARQFDGSLGDEYAFIETKTGEAFFEDYPFQIKNVLGGFPVRIEGAETCSHGFTAEELKLTKLLGKKPIEALILPDRSEKFANPVLEPVSALLLHKKLMPSVLGGKNRVDTFRALTSLLAAFDIGVLELHYKEAREAAVFLKDAFENGSI